MCAVCSKVFRAFRSIFQSVLSTLISLFVFYYAIFLPKLCASLHVSARVSSCTFLSFQQLNIQLIRESPDQFSLQAVPFLAQRHHHLAKRDLWRAHSNPRTMLRRDVWTTTFLSVEKAAATPFPPTGLTATTWFQQKPCTSAWHGMYRPFGR